MAAWSSVTSKLEGRPASMVRRPFDVLRYRTARFALIGVAATIAHGATLGFLSGTAGLSPLFANTAALLTAAALSYGGHRSFTFRSSTAHVKSLVKFVAQLGGAWVLTSAIAVTLIPLIGTWPTSALIVVLVPCFNYYLYARWTFR